MGRFLKRAGKTACSSCGWGQFTNITNATLCFKCDVGRQLHRLGLGLRFGLGLGLGLGFGLGFGLGLGFRFGLGFGFGLGVGTFTHNISRPSLSSLNSAAHSHPSHSPLLTLPIVPSTLLTFPFPPFSHSLPVTRATAAPYATTAKRDSMALPPRSATAKCTQSQGRVRCGVDVSVSLGLISAAL